MAKTNQVLVRRYHATHDIISWSFPNDEEGRDGARHLVRFTDVLLKLKMYRGRRLLKASTAIRINVAIIDIDQLGARYGECAHNRRDEPGIQVLPLSTGL